MEIVLHLGAHKTASTYLQSLLEKNIVPLERHRVGFACPKTLRPMFGIAPRRNMMTPRASRRDARTWALRQVMDTATDLQRERLIISEEQLIGSLRHLMLGKGMYRDVRSELRGVVGALNGSPVKVMMALRSYDTFFISAYGQVLSGWKYIRFTQPLRECLLRETRGWPEIVTDIMQALPNGSTLKLWQYETFNSQRSDVLSNLVGSDVAGELLIPDTTPRLGPSNEGIKKLNAMADGGADPDVETIRRVLREFGKNRGFTGYDPWTAEERTALQNRYARDIEMIRSLWPGSLIEDPETDFTSHSGRMMQSRRSGKIITPMTNVQKRIVYRRPAVDSC